MTRSAINRAAKTYAGLDVSLKETAICVVDHAWKIVFERSVATDPQAIAKYVAKHAVRLERFGFESGGSTSAGLWRELRKLGLPVICLDSRMRQLAEGRLGQHYRCRTGEDADVRRMTTVPGIGAITALAFKAAIDDPKRFTSSTKVGPPD